MDNSLERYVVKQQLYYEQALCEVRSGKKRTHWMWYIFPQIHGLGKSSTSKYYAIKSVEEARAYFNHEYLGSNLIHICEALMQLDVNDPVSVFGSIDALKLQSCMTLFLKVSGFNLFQQVLDKFYNGEVDCVTIQILNSEL